MGEEMDLDESKKPKKTNYDLLRKIGSFHTGGSVDVSMDNRDLYTTVDEEISVMNIESGKERMIKCEIGQITCFALSKDGRYLSASSRSMLVTLWNLEKHEKVRDWKAISEGVVLCMVFDSTSKLLALASTDGVTRIWDVVYNHCTHVFRGHSEIITSIVFHPDPQRELIASCSRDCTIRLWSLKMGNTRKPKSVVLDEHKSSIVNVFFTPSGEQLISGSLDKRIMIWDVSTAKQVRCIITTDVINSILPYPISGRNSIEICVLDNSSNIKIYNIITGEETKLFGCRNIEKLATSISGKYLISISDELDISLHNYDSDFSIASTKCGGPADVLSIDTLQESDPLHIAVATSSNRLRLYNTQTKECYVTPTVHSSVILCVSVNINKQLIATGGRDSNIFLWKYTIEGDRSSCEMYCACTGHADNVNGMVWSKKTCEMLLSASADKTVKIWCSRKGKENAVEYYSYATIVAHDKEVHGIDVSNNDKMFVTASLDKTAKIWCLNTGNQMGLLKGHTRGVWCAKFSSDDKLVATSSADKTVRLWNVEDYTCVNTLEGHSNSVVDLAFIKCSTQLVSCGLDTLIKTWDIKTSTCQKTLGEHQDRVWTISTCNDGQFLISGSSDESIIIYKDTYQEHEISKKKHRDELILLEQSLSNNLRLKNYPSAIRLLLKLDHQQKMLMFMQDIIECSSFDVNYLTNIIISLSDDELSKLLIYCRNWNTNWKYVHIAQKIINCVLTSIPSKRIHTIKNVLPLLNTIKNYSESHYISIDNYHTDLSLISYIIGKSSSATPLDNLYPQ